MGIEGLENDEGDALLHSVMDYLVDESFAYFHQWRQGDMVLWDNWRMLHAANGSPHDQERWMKRTTILGDYGLGRTDAANGVSEKDCINI